MNLTVADVLASHPYGCHNRGALRYERNDRSLDVSCDDGTWWVVRDLVAHRGPTRSPWGSRPGELPAMSRVHTAADMDAHFAWLAGEADPSDWHASR